MDSSPVKQLHPVQVRIKNFQSIEEIDMEINGFTCITGKTNIGKSAIIRAISGALCNVPVTGDVRKGAKFCSITLKSSDWGFTWEKSEKGGGTYYLENDKILDKIGQGQIEAIANMGFGSVQVGDEVVYPWLATQWESIFLLNKSGPAVTDFISDVSRLSVLQDAIILSVRGKKKSLDVIKVKEDSLKSIRLRESSVSCLDTVQNLIKDIEEQAKSIQEYETKVEIAKALLTKIKKSQSAIEILSGVESTKFPSPFIPELMERLKLMNFHKVHCENLARNIISIRGISSVKFSKPPVDEFDRFKKVSKYEGMPKLQKSIQKIEKVKNIKLNKLNCEELEKLKLANKHYLSISNLEKNLRGISKPPSLPELPESPERLTKAEKTHSLIQKLASEVSKLETQKKSVSQEIKKVKEELDSIPSCVSCGRPIVSRHSHEEIKTA